MDWHITKKYPDGKEKRLADVNTYEEAERYIIDHPNDNIYAWHTNAVDLDNPCFGMIFCKNFK